MTVRLLVVGADAPGTAHLAFHATRWGLPFGSLEVLHADPAHLGSVDGADGVWVAPAADGSQDDGARRAARAAHRAGIPVLATGRGLDVLARDAAGVAPSDRMPGTDTVGLHPADEVVAALLPLGWVLEATRPGGPADVLRLPGTAFLVAAPSAEPLTSDGAAPHPLLWAFLGASRAREEARTTRERHEALALEDARPRSYVHQMRGPRHAWWRPLVALLLVVVGFFVVSSAVTVPFALLGLLPEDQSTFAVTTGSSLWLNLVLAALVPVTLPGLWVAFRRSPGRVLSVTGRMRWGWLGRCALVVLPVWVLYLGASWVLFDQEVLPRPQDWVGLLVVTLLTTPLQAAGEEVAFRGGLVQTVGAWIPSERTALLVTTALSAVAFGLAHGSLDPWILIDVGSLAVAGCYLAWRTGGLEAAIAIHVVNNLLITVTGILAGGLEESYIDTETTGSALSTLPGVVAMVLVSVLLLRSARRRGIAPAGWLTPARG